MGLFRSVPAVPPRPLLPARSSTQVMAVSLAGTAHPAQERMSRASHVLHFPMAWPAASRGMAWSQVSFMEGAS